MSQAGRMVGVVLLATVVGAVAVFELLAYRFGADSRPVFDERPERGQPRRL
jgi:hypothetical protein